MRYALMMMVLILSLPAGAQVRVLACEPHWAALAKSIGGDRVEVRSAIRAGQDAHSVQARPGLIAAVRRADLVFCTGAGLETGWLPTLLDRGGNPDVRRAPGLLLAAEQVELLEKPEQLDRAQGDLHAAGNPHLHLDPRRMARVARAAGERLATLDPDQARHYRDRAEQLAAELTALADELAQQAGPLRGMPVVVHHRSWVYLLDWLGLERTAELEPRPGLPPTPGHLSRLVDEVPRSGARLILYHKANGSRAADWLDQRTPACAVELPFTVEDPEAADLETLYRNLVETLLAAREGCDDSG